MGSNYPAVHLPDALPNAAAAPAASAAAAAAAVHRPLTPPGSAAPQPHLEGGAGSQVRQRVVVVEDGALQRQRAQLGTPPAWAQVVGGWAQAAGCRVMCVREGAGSAGPAGDARTHSPKGQQQQQQQQRSKRNAPSQLQ